MTPQGGSIRKRLSRRVLAVVCAAWLGTIALAALFLDHELNESLDQEMQALAETTVQFLDATPGEVIPRSLGLGPEGSERVLRILRPGALAPPAPWSPRPDKERPPEPQKELRESGLHADGLYRIGDWRVLRLSAEKAVIEVGHNGAWRREEMLEASSAFLVLLVPMLALLLWGVSAGLRRGLAPLESLAETIATRNPEDPSPVEEGRWPSELAPVAVAFNGYLARIDGLRQAERRFVANASHELRTPLAALRARLELSSEETARLALPTVDALTQRLERLLQLARSEAGLGIERQPVDLVQLIRLLLHELAPTTGPGVRFDDGDFERLEILGDADALAILLRNLLENALRHGTGEVRITLEHRRLTIRNPVKDARFHDAPFAKRPGSPGIGLGLAIVDQLAKALGLRLEKHIAEGMAIVVLHLAEPD